MQSTNFYSSLNIDFNVGKGKFLFQPHAGLTFIATASTVLYLEKVNYIASTGQIVGFTPTAYYHKNQGIGANFGFKFRYRLPCNYSIFLDATRVFDPRYKATTMDGGSFSKSEWISVGGGVSKKLWIKKKKKVGQQVN